MTYPNGYSAVLTGDLIGSTKATPSAFEQAIGILEQTATDISNWQSDAKSVQFTRFRGDGWQIVLNEHWLALRAALVLIAGLRAKAPAPPTRIAIGIGAVTDLGTDDLSDAAGEAFVTSGRGLDQLGRIHFLTADGTGITPLHRSIISLLEERITRWTPQQAEAMALWLDPDNPTLADIGKILKITPQAVNYRLSGAGGTAIRQTVKDWEWEQEFEPVADPANHQSSNKT